MMEADGRLYHSFGNGKAMINGFLEDYSFLAESLIELYQITFEEFYLQSALKLVNYVIKHFYEPANGFFYLTSDLDPPLISRNQELYDNVIPSSNSVMARVLSVLALVYEREDFADIAAQMIANIRENVKKYPSAYSNWASVMFDIAYPYYYMVITGPNCLQKAKELRQYYYPGLFICGSQTESKLAIMQNRFVEGETLIFVCSGKECKLPTKSVEEAAKYFLTESLTKNKE
jgi:uncharacterized protein YyaL (SSP411 family)